MQKTKWWIPNLVGLLLSLLMCVVVISVHQPSSTSTSFSPMERTVSIWLQAMLATLALFGVGFSVALGPVPKGEKSCKVISIVSFCVATFMFLSFGGTYLMLV